jgi:hypothetical protein
MSYEIILSPQAEEDMTRWPGVLQDYIEEQLLQLATDPVGLSRPSAFPYPPSCQLFLPDPIEHDGADHEFVVLFRYSQDETALEVVGIGHIERPPQP